MDYFNFISLKLNADSFQISDSHTVRTRKSGLGRRLLDSSYDF